MSTIKNILKMYTVPRFLLILLKFFQKFIILKKNYIWHITIMKHFAKFIGIALFLSNNVPSELTLNDQNISGECWFW